MGVFGSQRQWTGSAFQRLPLANQRKHDLGARPWKIFRGEFYMTSRKPAGAVVRPGSHWKLHQEAKVWAATKAVDITARELGVCVSTWAPESWNHGFDFGN